MLLLKDINEFGVDESFVMWNWHTVLLGAFILATVIAVDEMITANVDAFYFPSIATLTSLSNAKVDNASSTQTVVSEIKRADCPPLQPCPKPGDISYIVTTISDNSNSVEKEFIGQPNSTRLTIQPGEFKIDVLPAKSVGLGWEYVNSTFSGDCTRGQHNGNKGNDESIQGIGSIGAGETQKCIVQNYYETYPGYKGEENIQDDKLKN
jgi:hypothetical protein